MGGSLRGTARHHGLLMQTPRDRVSGRTGPGRLGSGRPPIFSMEEEGRKEMFYLTTHSTHLRLYGVIHMVKDHSESERGNPLPPHGLLFPNSSKGSFICINPQTG